MNNPEQISWSANADLLDGLQVVELPGGVAAADCGAVLAQRGARVARCAVRTTLIASREAQVLMQQHLHGGKSALQPAEIDSVVASVAVAAPLPGQHTAAILGVDAAPAAVRA